MMHRSRQHNICVIFLLLVLCILSASCRSTYPGQVEQLQSEIRQAKENGARFCAPKDFSSAEAYLEFALIAIHDNNFLEADSYLSTAESSLAKAKAHLVHCDTDIDRDGVLDVADLAPYQAEDVDGFQDADGKPDLDNDNDLIPDDVDADPNLAEDMDGFEDADGKPDLDNDGDGVPDMRDGAPDEAEDMDNFADSDGVPDPDNDMDGYLDASDQCPNEPETYNDYLDEDGCPDVRPLVRKVICISAISFYSGSSRLHKTSFPTLQRFADNLNSNPEIRVRIEGHTDDVGDEKANMLLSKQRAERVQAVLVGFGVAPERLEIVGYGESNPIAENKTSQGRLRNRRIDFVLIQSAAPVFTKGQTPQINEDDEQRDE